METEPPRENREGGNKVFLAVLLALNVLIIILILFLNFGSHAVVCGPPTALIDDVGLCKIAVCDGNSCVVETVGDCCGNSICEVGEFVSNCPIDCAEGSEITKSTDSSGNTYEEFHTDEVVCEPNSGVSDGAICDCTETDCSDGVDNDGDGQIDCHDPDCDCLEGDCPPCEDCPTCENETACRDECGQYPDCAGDCVSVDGATGTCVQGDDGCCHCESVLCEDQDAPACEGICRDYNEVCIPRGDKCVCIENNTTGYECSDMDTAYCGEGTCPPGEKCKLLQGECGCAPAYCGLDSEPPACEGICQTGEECQDVNGSCECVQTDCADMDVKYCQAGYCPDDQVCQSFGNGCMCVTPQVDCEDSGYPRCGGDCPDDQVCTAGQDSCFCYEETSNACGDMDPGSCSEGACDRGYHCYYTSPECECVPDEEDNCSDQTDNDWDGYTDCDDSDCEQAEECQPDFTCANVSIRTCDIGICPEGQVCVLLNNTCGCVRECQQTGPGECVGTCANGGDCIWNANTRECSCLFIM